MGTGLAVERFPVEDYLSEIESDEGSNFGLPIAPMTGLALAILIINFIRLN
jgi:hypothetical protein